MNKLSWFLYLADSLEKFSNLSALLAVVVFIIMGIWTFIYFMEHTDGNEDVYPPTKTVIFLFLFCCVATCLIPSRSTMYMIAGSEVSQTVVTSEDGKRILGKVESKIEKYLDSLGSSDKENK